MVRGEVNGVVTFYAGRYYHQEVDGSETTVRKYYALGSMTIAVRSVEGAQDTLKWVLGDHLGSTSVTANADGTWNSTLRYTAFGEVRYSSGITPTEYRFTNQLEQIEIGLYYYGARWYDPYLNHFVQADTIVPAPGNPMAWDRYAYVLNSPVRFSDPTGHANDAGGGVPWEDDKWWENSEEDKKQLYYYESFSVTENHVYATGIQIGTASNFNDVDYNSDYLDDPVISSTSPLVLIPVCVDWAMRFQSLLPSTDVEIVPNFFVFMDVAYHVGDVFTVDAVEVVNLTKSNLLLIAPTMNNSERKVSISSSGIAPPGIVLNIETKKGVTDLIGAWPADRTTKFSMRVKCIDCVMMNGGPLPMNWYPSITIPAR